MSAAEQLDYAQTTRLLMSSTQRSMTCLEPKRTRPICSELQSNAGPRSLKSTAALEGARCRQSAGFFRVKRAEKPAHTLRSKRRNGVGWYYGCGRFQVPATRFD